MKKYAVQIKTTDDDGDSLTLTEGPFDSREDAQLFVDLECGFPEHCTIEVDRYAALLDERDEWQRGHDAAILSDDWPTADYYQTHIERLEDEIASCH